jgi:integrase
LDIWVGKKRIRRSLKTDEYSLAIERARDITLELKRGRPAGATFAELVPKYLAWARDTKAAYRSERYQVPVIERWFEAHGAPRLADVTPYLIEQFRMEVCARNRLTTKKPAGSSRANANRYCALLRVMFNRARDWGLYDGPNPTQKVRFYPDRPEMRVLTDEEKAAVVAAAVRIRTEADPRSPIQRVIPDFLEFLFSTGLRRSEALHLRWHDVGDSTASVLGKGHKWRKVPLNSAARAIVERQPRVSAFVFDVPNRDQPQVFAHTIRRIRKLSGVGHFHLHLCRHWFTAALLQRGVDIKTIGDILGHSKISISLIYAHSSPENRQRAVDALDTKSGHSVVSRHRGDPPQRDE